MTQDALVNKFFQPRMEGEVDLITAARQALINAGIQDLTAFDNDSNIIFAADKNSNVQRFKLNTWIDTQYVSTRRNISEQRTMILDNADPNSWMTMFVNYHIPQMKSLGLPVVY